MAAMAAPAPLSRLNLSRSVDHSLDQLAALWFGNSTLEWLTALGVAALLCLLLLLAKRLLIHRLGPKEGQEAKAARDKTEIGELAYELARTLRTTSIWIFALYAGTLSLHLPHRLEWTLKALAILAALFQFGRWATVAVDFVIARYRMRRLDSDAASVTVISALGFVAKLIAWAILFLLALENVGVNVTALVAGLGVGGIAVALALQRILGDVLAALSIVVDKPFVIGDSIQVGEVSGSVKRVGLRTTRLKSVSGEEVVFANSDLLQSRIRNFKRMTERRTLLAFGVSLATPVEKLKAIPDRIREIVEAQGDTVRFDRAHLRAIGAYSFDFEAVYFVLSAEYQTFADLQQAVYLALLEAFANDGIEIASSVPLPRRDEPPAPPAESA
jgi:small-conductance mechanosensitive channel